MNIQIITSSYPAHPDDPSGTAGLFVRSFALELQKLGNQVIIQPVGRKKHYDADAGLIIDPLPWKGGDKELASLNLFYPWNWIIIFIFFLQSQKKVIESHKRYNIDRTLCMWALPSGLLGYWMKKSLRKPYDIWALGSDIWKIKKIPFLGKYILNKVLNNADRVFADGINLCESVKHISGRSCEFLPSTRILPCPHPEYTNNLDGDASCLNFLFVGRYHHNKGPDLLLRAFLKLPEHCQKRIRVHMYGLGPLMKNLKKFINDHDIRKYVYLNGPTNAQHLSNILKKVHYLIIPSRIESIPVIFSDALQMGTPVISTPVGDLKNLITTHHCGILADDVSDDALACAIESACDNNQRDQHAAAAYELSKQFDLANIVKKWLIF